MNALTQLAVKAAEGNLDALHDLINDRQFRRKLKIISRVIFRNIPLREHFRDAEDLEQDIYERVLRKIHTFERKCEIQTWVSKLAKNIQLKRLEKGALSENDEQDASLLEGVVDTSNPLKYASLRRAVERLNPRERRALALKVAGANVTQIGRNLGIAKSHAHRIIVKVQKLLVESI